MKQILDEIALIDRNLLELQDLYGSIGSFKKQSEQVESEKKQKAEQTYLQTIGQIDISQKQAEAIHLQRLADYRKKRSEIEQNSLREMADCERQIKNICDAQVRKNKKTIAWIENAVAEMPPKLLKEVVSGPTIKPLPIDLSELENLYNKIFDGSFRAGVNRVFHIDGYSAKASMVQEFLQKAIALKLFLENETQKTLSNKSNDIRQEYQRIQKRKQQDLELVALQEKRENEERARVLRESDKKRTAASDVRSAGLSDAEQLKKRFGNDLTARQNDFMKRYNSLMSSDLIEHFMDRMNRRKAGTGAMKDDWVTYRPKSGYPYYTVGDVLIPVKATEQRLISSLQAKLPDAFRGGLFKVPLVLHSGEAAQFFVQYQNSDKKRACEFAQCIVLQRLRCAVAGSIEVYFAEPDKSGQILGPISAPIQENEQIGIFNINSKDSIRETLKKLVKEIDVITGLLGNYRSVYEYNRNKTPRIKEKCLVFSDVGGIIDKEGWELIKVLWNNGFRCGITVIIVSSQSIGNIPMLYSHTDIDVGYLQSKELYYVNCANNKATIRYGQEEHIFFPCRMTNERESFIGRYRSEAKNAQKVDDLFASHFDAERAYPYQDATKALSLPIMLRNHPDGGIFEFVIDSGIKAHTLLTGGTGSGKTTFLYMLITSIIMNYHPDDVELWLVDYGCVSFQKYVNKRPKHVRFVSLEKTPTFTYSFLEYVDAFFNNRKNLFQKDNVDSLSAYRKLHEKQYRYSMPRVVMIVDEFHVMTQHAKESPVHNKILENILREYRKFGLSCIFSDQTCNTGLTSEGAKQIANRLAMRQNNIQDIVETIDVAKSNYSEEQLRQMERSQRGELWAKAFFGDSETDFEIEYFKAIYANEAEQQKALDTSLKRNDVVRVDTAVHIIDGEKRKRIRPEDMKSFLTRTTAAQPVFCMGVPTSIEPVFSFELEQRHGNNVLVAGRNAKIGCDVLAELLLSSSLKGNVRTVVFADPREKRLSDLKRLLSGVGMIGKPNIEFCTDYRSICGKIRNFSKLVKRRETAERPTVIMWIGMLDIYDEMSEYQDRWEEEEDAVQDGFDVSAEKADTACGDRELIEMAAQLGRTVGELIRSLGMASEDTAVKKDRNGGVYNAIPDITSLITSGGRYSLYNIVPLDSAGDVKRLKDFKTDSFLHKIGFAMSAEDSWDFGFGKRAAEIPDEEMALYFNGVKSSTFRPFLLKSSLQKESSNG